MNSIDSSSHPRNRHTGDVKRLLRLAIARHGSAKDIAIDCGVVPSALSHWLSDNSETCLPVDLLPIFMASTGDTSILEYIAEQAGFDLARSE